MVKTRYQILGDRDMGQRVYHSYTEVIRSIWNENGIKGFFKGLTSSYIGCLEGAVQWIMYEKLKKLPFRPSSCLRLSMSPAIGSESNSQLAANKNNIIRTINKPNIVDLFFMAAASKFLAICMTYPHEVIRTRIREQSVNGIFKYQTFLSSFQTIAQEEGIR
jgi:solute carrier family 25 protein 33/36